MRTIKRESGFTLVELMVAMVILTVGLLGLASSMGAIMRWQQLTAARAEMTVLADAKLEQLRGSAAVMSADTIEVKVGGSIVTAAEPYTDLVVGTNGRRYVLLWAVTAGPGATRNVQLRVKPEVDVPQTPARIDFSTLIAMRQ